MNSRRELTAAFLKRARNAGLDVEVVSDGAFNSQIALVGEAPGEREAAKGMPFIGGSGMFLWNVLKYHGVTRQHVYTTNVVKRRASLKAKTPDDDPKHKVIHDVELEHWMGLLRWELSQLPNLKYVLVLGNFAMRALTKETGITKWRGSVLKAQIGERDVWIICANNPAAVMREPKIEVLFRQDVSKLFDVVEGRFREYKIKHLTNPSYVEACRWIDKMHDEGKPVSIDIETISNETACFGLTNHAHKGMCINWRTLNDNTFSLAEERDLRLRLQRLVGDPNVQLIVQNGVFESYWLWYKDRMRLHKVWFDTLLAHHLLYPGLPHNLGALTAQYTYHPYYKDEGKDWKEGGDINQFWEYNIKDICITLACQRQLMKELKAAGLDTFFFDHVMRLQPHLVAATVVGVKIDVELKEVLKEMLSEQLVLMVKDFHECVHRATGDEDYNPSYASWKQLQVLFFNRLKLVGRGTSTDDTNRSHILANPSTTPPARDMLLSLNKLKKADKFLTTYVEMELDEDDRVRCEYKQFGTQNAPGRLSSSKVMWGSGMNLQNQPKAAQPMFVADDGYVFVYFDLAQAEARVVGWEADIPEWKEQFERARIEGGYDCHRALAASMWGMDYDAVPKEDHYEDGTPTKRFIAKRCRHGLNYRMGVERLVETTGLPLSEAEIAYALYHRGTPQLRRWWRALARELKRYGKLMSPMGRPLTVLGRIDEEAMKSIVAFKPQSCIGDKVSQVIYQCHEDDKWPNEARIVLNVHDALIALVREDKAKSALRIMKRHAESPIYIRGEPLIIPADCKISNPTVWEYDDGVDNDGKYDPKKHTIAYIPDKWGWHRWQGMKGVDIDD